MSTRTSSSHSISAVVRENPFSSSCSMASRPMFGLISIFLSVRLEGGLRKRCAAKATSYFFLRQMSRFSAPTSRPADGLCDTMPVGGPGPWMIGALLLSLLAPLPALAAELYYPGPGNQWQKRLPNAIGMNADKVAEAVRFAQAHEVNWSRQLQAQIEKDVAQEPYPQVLGETKERGGPAGIIVRHGYIVAEWGDVDRVDMSFSVAKSYLSTLTGLAIDRGLIKSVHDPMWKYVQDGSFDSPHNSVITWHMMLNQTSEWEGVVWDKPDLADRRRGYGRSLEEPGAFWEYNDVRVNRLALALLKVWNKPLPQVLKEQVMDPIGASDTWVWHGYRNSFVQLDGRAVQ